MLQGKPIKARIKAKPMNRLPIAPPVQIPNKNGFRATPPPPVYDPTTYATAQPRYVYTNGAIPQGTVPYSGQVMFVSTVLICLPDVYLYSNVTVLAIPATTILSWIDATMAYSTTTWSKLL